MNVYSKMFFTGELRAKAVRHNGGLNAVQDLGVLHRSFFQKILHGLQFLKGGLVVTNAGVAYMVDNWDLGTLNISNFNFHDSGTGITAATVGDVNLQTVGGPTTRATGTKSQPSANVLRSVATITYSPAIAVTEWGLFDTASRATSNLWDRKVFAAINADSIQFTYDLTINAGG